MKNWNKKQRLKWKNDAISMIIKSLKSLASRIPGQEETIRNLDILRLKMILRWDTFYCYSDLYCCLFGDCILNLGSCMIGSHFTNLKTKMVCLDLGLAWVFIVCLGVVTVYADYEFTV